MSAHPLQNPQVVRAIEQAASAHRDTEWSATGFTNLNDRASHPCGIFRGERFSVFAKLDASDTGIEQFTSELAGLELLGKHVGTPTPIGVARSAAGSVLLLEAVDETPAAARTDEQWRDIGRTFAQLHRVHADRFGLADFDGFFGPLRQDNCPVESNRWTDFYAQRRVLPRLCEAVDAGYIDATLSAGVERILERLPELAGAEPLPTLLHGDAQQNNVMTTPGGPVLVDAAPSYGHPELDLALIDYFEPVPDALFDGYREVGAIDAGFEQRRELWRLHGYLAVVAVDGGSAFGRPYVQRIAEVVARYR